MPYEYCTAYECRMNTVLPMNTGWQTAAAAQLRCLSNRSRSSTSTSAQGSLGLTLAAIGAYGIDA